MKNCKYLLKIQSTKSVFHIGAFHLKKPGNYSIALSDKKVLATLFFTKLSKIFKSQETGRDRTEQYVSKEGCIK